MDSTELTRLEQAAKSRYERARFGWSLAACVPLVAVVAVAALVSRRPSSALSFGALLFVAGALCLWRGRDLGRGFVPGVVSGVVPLVLSLVANLGHGCAAGHCSTWCVQACTVGGVTAGLAVSFVAIRRAYRWPFWVSASAMSMLTGAMGCSCIGFSGVGALAAGFAVGTIPPLARRMFASNSP